MKEPKFTNLHAFLIGEAIFLAAVWGGFWLIGWAETQYSTSWMVPAIFTTMLPIAVFGGFVMLMAVTTPDDEDPKP